MEDQNQTLREENRKYNDQLLSLEHRLRNASPESSKCIELEISLLKRTKDVLPTATTPSQSAKG